MTSSEQIAQLAALAKEAEATAVSEDALELLDRIQEGRFFVACLGQFKRGKSTLINALLGDEVLPSGVAPVTSVVTVVRWGEPHTRVRIGDGEWRDVPMESLGTFVSESENPENRKDVRAVEVFCRSVLLERGLCLVDTPGIGSVFAGNTAETNAFVPHIDAAIVVLGGDPPISGDELSLVRDVTARVSDVLFLLNKADRLSDAERGAALVFTHQVLRDRVSLMQPEVYPVSALERLRGNGPPREWDTFTARLSALAQAGGLGLVERAAARGVASLGARLEHHLREAKSALTRPVEESERRLEALRRCAHEAEQAANHLRFLFDAEQQMLGKLFDEKRTRFVAETLPEITRQLEVRLAASPTRHGPGVRAFAMSQAKEVTKPIVGAWMDRERPVVEREFAAVTERFVEHANDFLERLQASGALPADVLPARLAAETGLRAGSRYYFASFMTLTAPPLWQWFTDWFRTQDGARRAARAAAVAFAERLLEVNANRVAGDFDERITESRRSVEGALRRRLHEVVDAAEGAARRAHELRHLGSDAVETELAVLDRRLAVLGALLTPGGA